MTQISNVFFDNFFASKNDEIKIDLFNDVMNAFLT